MAVKFIPVSQPDRKPDITIGSPLSIFTERSLYWVENGYVIRSSNEWSGVDRRFVDHWRSEWTIEGEAGTWRTGQASIDDLTEDGCQHWFDKYVGHDPAKALAWFRNRPMRDVWEARDLLKQIGYDYQIINHPPHGKRLGEYILPSSIPLFTGSVFRDGVKIDFLSGEVSFQGHPFRYDPTVGYEYQLSVSGEYEQVPPQWAETITTVCDHAFTLFAAHYRKYALAWWDDTTSGEIVTRETTNINPDPTNEWAIANDTDVTTVVSSRHLSA